MAYATVLRRSLQCHLPIHVLGGSVIYLICKEVTRELKILWKEADWHIITGNGNRSDLMNLEESVVVNHYGFVILIPLSSSNSRSQDVTMDYLREIYTERETIGPSKIVYMF